MMPALGQIVGAGGFVGEFKAIPAWTLPSAPAWSHHFTLLHVTKWALLDLPAWGRISCLPACVKPKWAAQLLHSASCLGLHSYCLEWYSLNLLPWPTNALCPKIAWGWDSLPVWRVPRGGLLLTLSPMAISDALLCVSCASEPEEQLCWLEQMQLGNPSC